MTGIEMLLTIEEIRQTRAHRFRLVDTGNRTMRRKRLRVHHCTDPA